ncbi:MAG: hypothetical protein IJI19_09065 [Ruminococcus sp.]|nr:hypothetical protein [Ruminococcus sp.]
MKRLLCMIVLLAVMLSLCAVSASANAPLTPDIIITLDQPYEGDYLIAVLSDRNAFYQYDEQWYNDYKGEYGHEALWAAAKKIRSTRDEDGYDYIADIDGFNKENRTTNVGYPYDTFKIALYYPDTDTLVKTKILVKEKYIHLYQLTLDGKNIKNVQTKQDLNNGVFRPAVTTVRPYFQEQMIFQFLVCLAFNLVVEILIGLLFGYRKWKHILTIAVTNFITLILLTVSTILINPPVYGSLLSFPFAFFEIAVAAVEGTVYAIVFRRFNKSEKYSPWLAVLYAFVANAFTYVVGSLFI